jgi:hypothetical protein
MFLHASKLPELVVISDSDDEVLRLLEENIKNNFPSSKREKKAFRFASC